MNKHKLSSTVFSVYILISFYVFGGGVVNALVAYPTWRLVGEAEFPAFHQVDADRIIPLFVVFFFLSFIPQVMLFWFRPASIQKGFVWAALFFNLIVFISTVTIQVPIQNKLNEAYSLELINRLISTDIMYRRIPMIVLAIINFTMLYKVVRSSEIPLGRVQ